MDADIINRWNAVVSSRDTVWFLGDFAFAKQDRVEEILKQLNGNINVILGNHDEALRKVMAKNDFGGRLKLFPPIHELNHNSKRYVLCHYPIEEWNNYFNGSYHLHGHCHGRLKRKELRRYDVGLDVYGRPIELTDEELNNAKGWL